jgi:hypothetical protein
MSNGNIDVTMAFASIVVPPAMSSATARCAARDINPTVHVSQRFLDNKKPIVHVLRWFLDNRKTSKSGCSRSHAAGHIPSLYFSVLLQVTHANRRFYDASKS